MPGLMLTSPPPQEEEQRAPAVLLRLDGDARAGWDRMLTAGADGATLVVAAADGEQLEDMLSGLQEDPSSGPRVSAEPRCFRPDLSVARNGSLLLSRA